LVNGAAIRAIGGTQMWKKQIALWVCSLMTASGAALAQQNQPPPPPPPDTSGQQAAVPAEKPTAPDASQKVSDYNTQAQALPQVAPDPRHKAEIKALRSLADALDALPGATDAVRHQSDQVRTSADTLEKSKVTDVHSDTTKEALTDALAALDALQSSNPVPGMADKMKAAHDAVGKIDESMPFLKEKETIDDAFMKVGDALMLANQPVVGMVEKQPVKGQEELTPRQEVQQFREEHIFGKQFAISAGGGYASFGAKGLRDITQNGGEWDVRAILGTHTVLGAELAYVGTANELNGRMPGINSNAWIASNAFEGNLRLATPALRILPVQLFGFAGAGYNRFSLNNVNGFNASPLRGSDNTFVLPAGGGLQFNIGEHVAVDGRFTYRAIFDENLFGRDHNADMYTATARVGYVF
jgi:opacity protein-like surface antigen